MYVKSHTNQEDERLIERLGTILGAGACSKEHAEQTKLADLTQDAAKLIDGGCTQISFEPLQWSQVIETLKDIKLEQRLKMSKEEILILKENNIMGNMKPAFYRLIRKFVRS